MTLWVVLSLALSATSLVLLWPFLRRARATPEGSRDIAMFKQQLAELDREHGRGAVSEAETAETRREIEARIVAAAKRQETVHMTETPDRARMIAVALTMGWLVVGSVALYATIGRSELAGVRGLDTPAHRPLSMAIGRPAPAEPAPAAASDQLSDVNSMITRLAARLEANPNDLAGWQMLAWSYLNTDNATEAAKAYERAVALAPENAELTSLWGEAVVRASGGVVTEDAAEIFRRTLSLDSRNPRARFFEGLALDQMGARDQALRRWNALLEDTPPDADWRDGLIARIREATGQDAGQIVSGADLLPKGPSAEDVAAAAEMSATDRQAMIRGMVDGLAARLADAPGDPEGWARLIRSYGVLGDADAQAQALADARAAMADDAAGLATVNAAARDAGLN